MKEIYTEHWDPNQLKILAVASNEEWFNTLRAYRLETLHIGQKYKTVAAKWHKHNLYAKAHGLPFNKPKPATGHHQSESGANFDRNVKTTGKRVGKFFDDLFK